MPFANKWLPGSGQAPSSAAALDNEFLAFSIKFWERN
jgi:hypothetical protein